MTSYRGPVKNSLTALCLLGFGTIATAMAMMAPTPARAQDKATLAALTTAFDTPQTCRGFDPVERYGNALIFQIRRNDSPVGQHIVRFNRGKDGVQVVAQSNIDISFLGFTAYRFQYRSESLWQDGQLQRLSVRVDDDGKEIDIQAAHDGDRLIVDGPNGERTLSAGIFPTDHWHCGVLASDRVLNTLTGNPNDVQIRAGSAQMLRTTNGALKATEFIYDGDLKTTAWYDRAGRWVGLQFRAEDGSTIDYRCINCTSESEQKDQG